MDRMVRRRFAAETDCAWRQIEGRALRDASEATWWRRTWQFAAATIGGSIVLSLLFLLLASPLDGRLLFGIPLGGFLVAVCAPLAVLVAVFVFAARQRALDRRYDVAED
jgi:putative solute:sodium symporter small subunit